MFLYLLGMLFILIATFILCILDAILDIIMFPFKMCIKFITYLQEKLVFFSINIVYKYKKGINNGHKNN